MYFAIKVTLWLLIVFEVNISIINIWLKHLLAELVVL